VSVQYRLRLSSQLLTHLRALGPCHLAGVISTGGSDEFAQSPEAPEKQEDDDSDSSRHRAIWFRS
jgi:hypothetical protein